jgi:hypothetical protein
MRSARPARPHARPVRSRMPGHLLGALLVVGLTLAGCGTSLENEPIAADPGGQLDFELLLLSTSAAGEPVPTRLDGATIAGTVTIVLRSDVALDEVRVFLDGDAGTEPSVVFHDEPWGFELDARTLASGPHTLRAAARLAGGSERDVTATFHVNHEPDEPDDVADPVSNRYTDLPPATLYVATNGNDTNTGRTIERPLRTIQRAANIAQPGDTIYIRAGTYPIQVAFTRSGTPDPTHHLDQLPRRNRHPRRQRPNPRRKQPPRLGPTPPTTPSPTSRSATAPAKASSSKTPTTTSSPTSTSTATTPAASSTCTATTTPSNTSSPTTTTTATTPAAASATTPTASASAAATATPSTASSRTTTATTASTPGAPPTPPSTAASPSTTAAAATATAPASKPAATTTRPHHRPQQHHLQQPRQRLRRQQRPTRHLHQQHRLQQPRRQLQRRPHRHPPQQPQHRRPSIGMYGSDHQHNSWNLTITDPHLTTTDPTHPHFLTLPPPARPSRRALANRPRPTPISERSPTVRALPISRPTASLCTTTSSPRTRERRGAMEAPRSTGSPPLT